MRNQTRQFVISFLLSSLVSMPSFAGDDRTANPPSSDQLLALLQPLLRERESRIQAGFSCTARLDEKCITDLPQGTYTRSTEYSYVSRRGEERLDTIIDRVPIRGGLKGPLGTGFCPVQHHAIFDGVDTIEHNVGVPIRIVSGNTVNFYMRPEELGSTIVRTSLHSMFFREATDLKAVAAGADGDSIGVVATFGWGEIRATFPMSDQGLASEIYVLSNGTNWRRLSVSERRTVDGFVVPLVGQFSTGHMSPSGAEVPEVVGSMHVTSFSFHTDVNSLTYQLDRGQEILDSRVRPTQLWRLGSSPTHPTSAVSLADLTLERAAQANATGDALADGWQRSYQRRSRVAAILRAVSLLGGATFCLSLAIAVFRNANPRSNVR